MERHLQGKASLKNGVIDVGGLDTSYKGTSVHNNWVLIFIQLFWWYAAVHAAVGGHSSRDKLGT
jgi:hypothetical protein